MLDAPVQPDPLAELARACAKLADERWPAAMSPDTLAEFLDIQRSTISDWNARGLLPEPVQLGEGTRCPRWRRVEILEWLAAGAPARSRWELRRRAAG